VIVTPIRALRAQATPDAGVQITAAMAASRIQTGDHAGSKALFNGRIGFRVARSLYIGMSAGSWVTGGDLGHCDPHCGQILSGVASAVAASPYAQWYPFRGARAFVRGGIGFAHATTYTPMQAFTVPTPLVEEDHIRPSATSGMGVDFPVFHRLAATLSLDYTRILGALPSAEVHSLVMAGFGLTLH
jgi:hypothetical protein